MMMTKKVLGILIVLLAAGLMITGCFVEYDPTDVPEAVLILDSNNAPINGNASGTAQGFGGQITVTVTVTGGYISDVQIDAKNETPSYTKQLLDNAPGWIKQANSFDIDALSAVSPGVTTRPAIKKAGNAALDKIKNGE
jgi:uncharacterized protein with FMN-binding domain